MTHRPFTTSVALLVTGVVSFLLSNVLPFGWDFAGFGKHHGYGFPLLTGLGNIVPTVAVVLAAFFLILSVLARGGAKVSVKASNKA